MIASFRTIGWQLDYLKSLAVFVRVVERGSFAAVAEEFGLSGTMVGKHIQSLEGRLGGRLLVRTTRRQHLTDLGLQFCERARTILAEVEAANALGEGLRQQPKGILRVSAPTGLGVEVLVDAIASYREIYPEVVVELSIADRVVDLVDEGFHVAIRTGGAADENLVARTLRPYRVIACASPGYLDRHPPLADPDDLRSHHCLRLLLWGPDPVWRFAKGDEVKAVPVSGGFASDNVVALRRAAMAGMGIVVQAEALVHEALAAGLLRPVLPGWELRARPTMLVWPQHMRNSAKLRSFVDFIQDRMGNSDG